jgi:hypothetical protein
VPGRALDAPDDGSGYACFDFRFMTDELGSAAARAHDPLRYAPPHADVAWGATRALSLMSDVGTSLVVSERDYEIGVRPHPRRSTAGALAEAAAAGYTEPVADARELSAGAWTRVGDAWVRFETRRHVGDASEYDVGSIRLACADPGSHPAPPTAELLDDRRGTRAFVFAAGERRADAPLFVLGVLREGGGEGSYYVETWYRRVMPADCAVR